MNRIPPLVGLASVAALSSAILLPASPAAARPAGVNANAQADLRSLATLEEEYFTEYGRYGNFTQLIQSEPNQMTIDRGVTVTIVHYRRTNGYCFRATTATATFMYDALAGGNYKGKHCRAVTTGPNGGTRTGPSKI